MSTATKTSTRTALGGKRKLSLIDTVAQSVGFMGPVFSVAFLVPLLVGLNAANRGAGAAAPLAVVIAGVGVIGLGWIIAEYSRRIHAAGSLYDYVTDGLGSRVGTAAGYLYYAGILALTGGILVMTAGTIRTTILSEFNVQPLPQLGWELILLVIVLGVLYWGVSLSTKAQLTLALISIAVIFSFCISVIVTLGHGNHVGTAFQPSSSPTHWSGVLFGVLYAVLLFTGFEGAANLAEETANPKRTIPRAILISVVAIALFYVIATYTQIAGFHFNLNTIGKNAAAPLFGLASPSSQGGFGSVAIRRLTELVVVLDMTAVLIGTAVSVSRGIFALSRDERLPKTLSRVSRRGTPITSIMALGVFYVITMILTLTTSIFALPSTPHYVALFSWYSTFGGFALVVIYLLMTIGALRGLRNAERPWTIYLACLIGAAVTIGAIYGSIYKVSNPTIWAPYTALIILGVGLVVAFSLPKIDKKELADFSGLSDANQGVVKL